MVACGAPVYELDVMSFNIRYGTARDGDNAWPLRADLVIGVIDSLQPHVVGLQEALRFQLDEMAAGLEGYAEIGVGRDDGDTLGEYAAILYRTDRLHPTEAGTFWFSDTPEIPGSMSWGNSSTRICTWAAFEDLATGARFTFYNVHLDHESQPSRERSVELLVERIRVRDADGPVVVTGDFNTAEDNPALIPLREALGYADPFRALHPEAPYIGTFSAFRGDSTGAKIDYVFVSDAWDVRDARIVRDRPGGRDPSDHFPVTARLVLARQPD